MNKLRLFFWVITVTTIMATGCDNVVDSNTNSEIQSSEIGLEAKKPTPASTTCQSAGTTGQTALYVNQSVKAATIDFSSHSCDIGIYFDENAPKNAFVKNATVINEKASGGILTGIWNNGGDVTISNSVFTTDFSSQFVPIRFDEGASGTISRNELSGTHRVAILVRGEGTDVEVKGNTVVGSGAKSSGWAENGIQVDQGATASIKNNELMGHWWDGETNWASTGILIFGSGPVEITNNNLHNNEFSIVLFTSNSKVTGNKTTSDIESQSALNFQAYGALVGGANNHLAGNSFSATNGAVGIYIYPDVESNDITGNRIKGFDFPIYDGGTDTKVRGTPAPPNGV